MNRDDTSGDFDLEIVEIKAKLDRIRAIDKRIEQIDAELVELDAGVHRRRKVRVH